MVSNTFCSINSIFNIQFVLLPWFQRALGVHLQTPSHPFHYPFAPQNPDRRHANVVVSTRGINSECFNGDCGHPQSIHSSEGMVTVGCESFQPHPPSTPTPDVTDNRYLQTIFVFQSNKMNHTVRTSNLPVWSWSALTPRSPAFTPSGVYGIWPKFLFAEGF